MAGSITPTEVLGMLKSTDSPVGERRLTDWREKGLLPELIRADPPAGWGRGAYYVWADRHVAVQALTLDVGYSFHGRRTTMALLAWLAGFDYPVAEMRAAWANLEERPWRGWLREALGGLTGDVPAAIRGMVLDTGNSRAHRGMKLSKATTTTWVRYHADPNYRPERDLTLAVAEKIRLDLPRVFKKFQGAERQMEAVLPYLRTEHLRGALILAHDFISRPRLVELIRQASDDELEAVHHDCHVLMGIYRAWALDALESAARGEEPSVDALWLAPRFAWRVGRSLMRLDLGLRRKGYAPQIDQTVSYLSEITTSPENVALFRRTWQLHKEVQALAGDDVPRYQQEVQTRFQGTVDSVNFVTVTGMAFGDLQAIWTQIWKEVVERLVTAGSASPDA